MDQVTRNKTEMFQNYKSAMLMVGRKPDEVVEVLTGMSKTACSFDDIYDTVRAMSSFDYDAKLMPILSARLAKKVNAMSARNERYEHWHNMLDLLNLKSTSQFSDLKDAIFEKMLKTADRALLYALTFELNLTGGYKYVNPKWFEMIKEEMLSR